MFVIAVLFLVSDEVEWPPKKYLPAFHWVNINTIKFYLPRFCTKLKEGILNFLLL